MKLVDSADPILHSPVPEFHGDPASLSGVARQMLDFMESKCAVGLAANQVGLNIRMFVMSIPTSFNTRRKFVCINPTVVSFGEDSTVFDEGCLSYPDEYITTSRPTKVQVSYINTMGVLVHEELSGLAGICFQHECDHLNGITFHQRSICDSK